MLIVLFVITIAIMIGLIIAAKHDKYSLSEEGLIVGFTINGFVTLGVVVAVLVLGSMLAGAPGLDQKIIMHEEENQKIELVIKAEVQNYLEHEHDTYVQIGDDEDVEILIVKYPELHSNVLVQQQLQILKDNNDIIRQLKTEKIDLIKVRWWLYFGK